VLCKDGLINTSFSINFYDSFSWYLNFTQQSHSGSLSQELIFVLHMNNKSKGKSKVKVKVKQSHYRPGVAQSVPGS